MMESNRPEAFFTGGIGWLVWFDSRGEAPSTKLFSE